MLTANRSSHADRAAFSRIRAAILAAACVSGAHGAMAAAQTASAPQDSKAPGASQSSTHDGEGEITVTARRRDERLVDVPASVAVVTAAAIEARHIVNVDDLIENIPGLYISSNALSPGRDLVNLVIRGIGAQSVGVPAVGTFVDGVYTPSLGFDTDFVDVERVEVLKGPQGTLFGRNTEGGALSIVTRKPTQTFQAKAQMGYDNFNTYTGRVSVSGGLTDTLAASIAVDYSNTDGYLEAKGVESELQAQTSKPVPRISADDMRSINVRGDLRWQPDSKTDINLTADISDKKGHDGLPGVPIGNLPGGRSNPFAGLDKYGVYSDFQVDAHYKNRGASLTIDRDLGFAKLTSLTGYRYLSSLSPYDFDGGTDYLGNYYDMRSKQTTLSEELRLAGDALNGRLNWLAGLYAFKENDNTYRSYDFASTPELTGLDIDLQNQLISRKGYAAFGQASFKPVDRIEVTAGVRYSWEHAHSNFAVHYTIPNYYGPGETFTFAGTADNGVTFTNVAPTASIRFAVTPTTSLYTRYAKGFKAGGFPIAPGDNTSDAAFKSETSDNYEVGFKGDLFHRLISFDLSTFYINIDNQQLSTIIIVNGNIPLAAVANAGKSRSKGFEASATLHPVAGLSLGGSTGYTDARYLQYVDTAGVNRAGDPFPYTPKWTYNFNVDYDHELGNGWKGNIGATYTYVDKILSGSGVDIDLQFPVPSYHKIDLRAGVKKGPWHFDVYADNVTNQYIITRIFNSFFFPDPPARPFAIVQPPRRVGGRLTYSF